VTIRVTEAGIRLATDRGLRASFDAILAKIERISASGLALRSNGVDAAFGAVESRRKRFHSM
jgi:hypothetical protein